MIVNENRIKNAKNVHEHIKAQSTAAYVEKIYVKNAQKISIKYDKNHSIIKKN